MLFLCVSLSIYVNPSVVPICVVISLTSYSLIVPSTFLGQGSDFCNLFRVFMYHCISFR
uniref:Uncharacterized protein n=1 Tax=Arundo donax TaxID=35708 RepID=A0A0A8ZJ93_ARUDO